ncbi:arsenate reductase/protein-tyrosine-phosphatase family protein [Kineococcus sp. SYSU DK018]|uniref:arsenate reductase/protein-tyrosine-phosphatase family protein n=1 Tax=Kineococcus sp. SYSU DK018 TaxID=3383139 RepID=UPI003D7C84D1
MSAAAFTVLVVCTANVHRSPMAAALLRHRLDERFGTRAARVRVGSAGTRALTGHGVDPTTARVLAEVTGTAPAGTAARQLDEHLVHEADAVLVMTREHRAAVVDLLPAAQRRTFTLPELARIAAALPRCGPGRADADPAAGWRALLAAAPALRGPTAPADPAADDVADVHLRPEAEHRSTAQRLAAAVEDVLDAVAAPPRAAAQRSVSSGSASVAVSGW